EGELRDHCPLVADRLIQAAMFRGINHIDPTAKHGDCPSTSLQCPLVRQAIDTTRQAADHCETILGQLCTQTLGRQLAIWAWLPSSHHCHRETVFVPERPPDIEHWRWFRDPA